jgi:hypothetical protein
MDENFLLLEFLASNGFIVINSAFQDPDAAWDMGVGTLSATFEDFNFIINYCRENGILSSNKVFLMGHSYGANSSIAFLGVGREKVDGIISLDSDFGYALSGFLPTRYNPFIKERRKFYNIPIFCVGRSEAHFRMVDSLSLSKRYYLTMSNMKHNDFTSLGAIGRYYCIPYVKEKDKYELAQKNFLEMCPVILQFLIENSKNGANLSQRDVYKRDGWKFEVLNPGEKLPFNAPFDKSKAICPTISQFLDIIFKNGLNEARSVYAQCPDSVFNNGEDLINMLSTLFVDANIDTTIRYLNWLKELRIIENNLRYIFFEIANESIWDRGDGYHYDKADKVYKWMVESHPDNEYGYMGRLLVANYTGIRDIESYCEKIVEIDKNYQNRAGKSYEEDVILAIINEQLVKKN